MFKNQFNFIFSFKISKKNFYERLLDSYKLLKHCMCNIKEEPAIFRRVAAVELRKLLCEGKDSLIFALDENIQLPTFGKTFTPLKVTDDEKLMFLMPYEIVNSQDYNIELSEWLNQKICYFDRVPSDITMEIEKELFEKIISKIEKINKNRGIELRGYFTLETSTFEYYSQETSSYESIPIKVYSRKEPSNFIHTQRISDLFEKIGYNHISTINLIKLVANREGAHTSKNHPLGLLLGDISKNYFIQFDAVLCVVMKYLDDRLNNNEQ